MKIKEGFVVERVGGQYLAVAVGELADNFNALIRMNATGAFIWGLLESGDMAFDELLAAMEKEYDAEKSVLRADLERFVAKLRSAGLINE